MYFILIFKKIFSKKTQDWITQKQLRRAIFQLKQFKEMTIFLRNYNYHWAQPNRGFSTKWLGEEIFLKQIEKFYRNRKFTEYLLARQRREKAYTLHDKISRQKQISYWSTLANILIFKKRAHASKNSYGSYNILPLFSNLFERSFSKQLAESYEIILSKYQCDILLGKTIASNIACNLG